ncbi:MAG: tryptophan 7-halogenase [Pseudomonadota bacterium]|nr:tryptophan 7-halogenase [Pseudomonadota bacterium]
MHANDRKRVLIIGGGPAACASALALLQSGPDPELDVNMVFSGPRAGQPDVGETIPPAATPVLRELGLNGLLQQDPHLICPGSLSVWGDDKPGHNDFLLRPVGCGFHLDRSAFDARLRHHAAGLGCRLESGWRLRKVESRSRGHRLAFHDGQNLQWEQADFVIDASGIGAAFARRIGIARNLVDEVIALCALLPAKAQTRPAHTLIQAVEKGWWYAGRLPGDRAIVSLTTDTETSKASALSTPKAWHRALQETRWFSRQCRHHFGTDTPRPAAIHPKPMPSAILSAVVGEDWLAVGDAASSYDAMSSAGITKALMHGQIAGRALATYLRDADTSALAAYQDRVFQDFNTYLGLHQQHYRAERRFPHSRFWQRRRLGR